MRLTAILVLTLSTLPFIGMTGCNKPSALNTLETTVTLSVDMPRDQTLQFLKQSATTLKLAASLSNTADSVTAGPAIGVVSGPDAGPVTVVFTGDDTAITKWSTMLLDKLPAKKL